MKVFEKSSIGGVTLSNRVIRSATHEGMGDAAGNPLPQLTDLYLRLAGGGVGAIITGFAAVQQSGKAVPNMRMFDDDRYIDDYKKLNGRMGALAVPVFNQIVHSGGSTASFISGTDVVSPSPMKSGLYLSSSRGLTEDEIQEIINSFVAAIVRSKESGFSGVQLHAAHGFLLSEFLSPHVNRRRDSWGGSTENRFRIIGTIMERAREKVGAYPIMAKISAYDGDRGGVTLDEGLRIAELFQKSGCDGLEVSCGGINDGFNTLRVPRKIPADVYFTMLQTYRDLPAIKKKIIRLMMPLMVKRHTPLYNFNVDAAEAIKRRVDMPVIAVGGIRKLADIEEILGGGKADYVAMSRPLIREPALVNTFRSGEQAESRCINCGYCLFGVAESQLRCYNGKLVS